MIFGKTVSGCALECIFESSGAVVSRTIIGEEIFLLLNGHINTRRGAVLASDGEMIADRDKDRK